MTSIDLLKFMLLDFLIENFEIVSVANSEENIHLYFEEKAKPPTEFNTLEFVSEGFMEEITIRDFPLRGKFSIYTLNVAVGLIKHRRSH